MKFIVKTSKGFERMLANLANIQGLAELAAREAMAEALLRAIRTRFNLKQTDMATYLENNEAIDQSKMGQALRDRLRQVRQALDRAHSLRAGAFGSVVDRITDTSLMVSNRTSTDVTVATGSIQVLDQIISPSATQLLRNRNSSSPYNILWRQMEFGTGIMRKQYPGNISPTRYTTDKGWWYGPKTAYRGVHFKGTKPGNLLRTQSGLPYTEDALKFQREFGQRLRRYLNG